MLLQHPDLASVVPLSPSYLRSTPAGGREMRALVLTDRRTAANDDHTNATKTSDNNADANTNIVTFAKKALLFPGRGHVGYSPHDGESPRPPGQS